MESGVRTLLRPYLSLLLVLPDDGQVDAEMLRDALNRMTVLCEPGSKDHILFCFPDSIAV